jgi:uncharacterized membrane protein
MIVTQDSMRVAVPPMSAYEHLVRFSEYTRFMSGVLGVTPVHDTAAHMALDIGGRRVEIDAVIADVEPGRFVRWDSAQLIESFWLSAAGDDATDVVAVAELDDSLVRMYERQPDAALHARLHMDLKGFKRFCEESSA